jgi:septal ring factor EnvC (AmiA/AmiB activator)
VRIRIIAAAVITLILFSLTAFVGCAGKAKVCAVSPIDIEEVKSDSRDLDEDLAGLRERLKRAQDDLAGWQSRLAKRRTEVPELEAELARVKKMSGVTEEMVVDVEPKTQQAQDIQLMPRSE